MIILGNENHFSFISFVLYSLLKCHERTDIPSNVGKCEVPPDHLRNENSFSRTCNIPNIGNAQMQEAIKTK